VEVDNASIGVVAPLGWAAPPNGGSALKITLENWPYVQKKAREVGIKDAEYNSKGELQAIVTKDGERFEFSVEAFEQFKNAGLLRLGRGLRHDRVDVK
jgi:hypothetical protein